MSELDETRRAELAAVRQQLWDRYGRPTFVSEEAGILVVKHPCRESADAFAEVHEQFGFEDKAWTEQRDGEWVRVHDYRAQVEELRAKFTESWNLSITAEERDAHV